MGLIEIRRFSQTGRIGFWKAEGPLAQAQGSRKQGLTAEFLRFLNVFPGLENETIHYDGKGKPGLSDNRHGYISISHSGGMLVMTHDTAGETGVDYEKIRGKIIPVSNRFLGDKEKAEIGTEPSADRLHIYWGAKESLFKKYGDGGLIFSKHLYVSPFDNCEGGETRGSISIPGRQSVNRLAYKKCDDHMLVYLIND